MELQHRKDITSRNGIRSGRRAKNYKMTMVTKIDLTTRVELTDAEIKEERQRLLEKFPRMVKKVSERIFDLTTLDQAWDGACTIAALFNLLHIEGKDSYHPKKKIRKRRKAMTWDQIKQLKRNKNGEQHGVYFHKKVYSKLQKQFGTYGSDRVGTDATCIGETLQAGIEIKLPVIMNVMKDTSFRYIPITSESTGLTYLNRDIVGNDPAEIYNELAKYIETRIDNNIPIAISQNGHARVIVGYNDKSIMFLDSWGDNYAISNADNDDKNKAGFSTMDKWEVYSSLRDIAYFESDLSEVTARVLKLNF